jgi:hypothetical protein
MIGILWEYWGMFAKNVVGLSAKRVYPPKRLTKWGQTVETGDLRYVRRRGLGSHDIHDGELFFCWRHFFTEEMMTTRRLLLFIPTGTRSERNTCGPCGPFFPRVVSWHRQTWHGSLICQVIFLRSYEYFCPVTIRNHHLKNTWGYGYVQ